MISRAIQDQSSGQKHKALCGLSIVASMLAASGRDAAASEVVSLTVPYVRQPKILCGGAAAAMVFRYWGDGQADPNQFAPLLDRAAGGIAADVLAQAIDDRGWREVRFVGAVENLHDLPARSAARHRAARGSARTVSLRGRGRDDGQRIVLHGPARGPSRRVTVRVFVERWQRAGFWALLVLPPPRDDVCRWSTRHSVVPAWHPPL